MKSVSELEKELREAIERDRLTVVQCMACDGKGWISDTTYDRCGVDLECGRCHGTGFPKKKVDELIAAALAPFKKAIRSPDPGKGG